MAARIIGDLVDAGVSLKKVVTDGDSSTINAIHEQVDPGIEHGLDTNHFGKSYYAALEKMKKNLMKTHKEEAKLLTPPVLERLRRSLWYIHTIIAKKDK